jgi:ribonuclease P/MRP protein subunit POP5
MRRRYLALKVEALQEIDEKELKNTVWNAVLRLFGEYGASKTGLFFVSYDSTKNYAILRCTNAALDMVRASLASTTEINLKPAAIHLLGISGTLKSLREKFPPE